MTILKLSGAYCQTAFRKVPPIYTSTYSISAHSVKASFLKKLSPVLFITLKNLKVTELIKVKRLLEKICKNVVKHKEENFKITHNFTIQRQPVLLFWSET